MTDKWRDARAQMLLDPQVANLNTGSFGPLPRVVFERATQLRQRQAEEPMDFLLRQMPPLLWQARQRLAEFIGADARRLLFTANVSVSVNIVASGLRLNAPGEILVTDHEYRAMQWVWERAAQKQGLALRFLKLSPLPSSPAEIVEAAIQAFTPRTRLFFFSHILSPTGMVLPAKELCAEARRRGILTMVDGAHALGMLPLKLEEINADFYGSNCHKWLLAPTGAGFLYLGQGSEDRLEPMQVSWGYHRPKRSWHEPDPFGTTPRLRFYEFEGTRDLCPWLSVPTAIDFQAALGFEQIRAHNEALVQIVRRRFGQDLGLPFATPEAAGLHGFMTAFHLPQGVDAEHWRRELWERHHIEVPLVDRPDGLLLRVSTHFYNTVEEIEKLAAAVGSLLRSA